MSLRCCASLEVQKRQIFAVSFELFGAIMCIRPLRCNGQSLSIRSAHSVARHAFLARMNRALGANATPVSNPLSFIGLLIPRENTRDKKSRAARPACEFSNSSCAYQRDYDTSHDTDSRHSLLEIRPPFTHVPHAFGPAL